MDTAFFLVELQLLNAVSDQLQFDQLQSDQNGHCIFV